MSFCTDPNSIISIDINECVGNSLTTMNTNFNILNGEVCDQYSDILTNKSEKNILTSRIISLSSLSNLMPKCSVKFDDEGTIISSEGINRVDKLSTGNFRVFFEGNFNDNNYLAITSSISEIPCWVFVTFEHIGFLEIKARNSNGNLIDPNFINLTVFSKDFIIFGNPVTPTPTRTPTLTPTVTPTLTLAGILFTLDSGTFNGTYYFAENGLQQINMTYVNIAHKLYLYNNYDGSTLSYTSTVVVVNGTPVASISHTTDRIGDQFGYSTSGPSPQAFGVLNGGTVNLTI